MARHATRQRRSERTAEEVFRDHLRRRVRGDVDGDLRANYADDVVLIDRYRVRYGWQGVREAADQLGEDLPDPTFEFVTTHVTDQFAYLEWRGHASGACVEYGVDTFVIRDGLIRAQTVYYRVATAPALAAA